jgi:hypothetical protein
VIRTPRRAVTRFFIPLIDVLILLFCIFLLMPFVSRPDAEDVAGDLTQTSTAASDEIARLRQELADAKRRIEVLKKERANLFERFRVKVLEIDAKTGRLYSLDEVIAGRQEVRTQADATRLIERERSRAGAKDVCFLLLFPRELTGFPLRDQLEAYRRWFRGVPHSFDNPWAGSQP